MCMYGTLRTPCTVPLIHGVSAAYGWRGWPCSACVPEMLVHGLRRDIAAAAHTQKSSGSPGPPCFRAWFVGLRPRPRRGTLSWPILTVGAPGNSPSNHPAPLYNTFGVLPLVDPGTPLYNTFGVYSHLSISPLRSAGAPTRRAPTPPTSLPRTV